MLPDIPGLGGTGALIVAFLIAFIIYLIIIGFVLWVAGEIVVGGRVTFGQALAIAGAGTFLTLTVLFFLPGPWGLLAGFVLFLALIRHYFKTGWLAAVGVAIMAVIVAIVITFVLAILAIGLFTLPSLSPFV